MSLHDSSVLAVVKAGSIQVDVVERTTYSRSVMQTGHDQLL